jgi:hypothetical protein
VTIGVLYGYMWKHLARGLLRIIIFAILSAIALAYAFGYQVNWAARSIQQTGIIYLRSEAGFSEAEVFINGGLVSRRLPYRQGRMLPGFYTVLIRKPGYRDWQYPVRVEANRVSSFPTVFLVYENLTPTNLQPGGFPETPSPPLRTDGIVIRNRSDLYLQKNGEFRYVNRYERDIITAAWHPNRRHLILQIGNSLNIVELDNALQSFTHKIVDLPNEQPVELVFQENGRVVAYRQGAFQQAVELYGK